ncbi:MAG: aminopeptidase P N-terminal domain-containing protein [Planctomycetota bacterium]
MKRPISIALVAFAITAGAFAEDGARAPGDQDDLKARAFSAERTHGRRRALAKALGEDVLVVLSSGRSTESDAVGHRANRDFLYLSGIEDPTCFMIIEGERQVLFAPPRDERARRNEVWNGPRLYATAKTAREHGFDEALSTETFAAEVAAALERRPAKVYVGGFTPAELEQHKLAKAEKAAGAIGKLRQIKDEHEVALLRRAAEISAAAHIYCARAIGPDRYEYEVQGLFEGLCRFYGCEAQGYPSIIGSGPNSCVLHYSKDRRRMKAGDLLLNDSAGECGGYSADVTRTFPVSGTFTPEQRKIYEAVLRSQEAGIKACVPGKTIRDVGEASRRVLVEAGLDKYLPHGVSHWLGLDVHDAGDYALPLAPGMVLTVEPGVYIPEKELGVRIEDDILVTEDGPVNLSEYAPRSVEEIEALMKKAREGKLDFTPMPQQKPLPSLRRHKGKLY